MITGTGNSIANGDFDSFLDSLTTQEPIRCTWCLEVHEEDEKDCEAPRLINSYMTLKEAKIKYRILVKQIKLDLAKLSYGKDQFVRKYNKEMNKQYRQDCVKYGKMTIGYWYERYCNHKQILYNVNQLNNI